MFWTNKNLIMFLFCFYACAPISFLCYLFLQMSRNSSRGKEPVIELTSSPVSKRTRHSSKVSNSETLRLSRALFRTLPQWWSGLSSLTPLDPPLSLGFLQTKIRRIYLETLRIRLMNWLRSSTQMLDSLEQNYGVRFEEKSSSLLRTTLQRSFASLNPKMWIAPHMMTNFPKCHIFFKFLELNMRSQPKAHPLEQRSSNLN